jgi:hypothetical protein
VVGAVREGCVVEHAIGLVDPHRRATECGDQLLSEGPLGMRSGQAEDRRALEIDGRAGEGHGGVERDRASAPARQGGESVEAVATTRVKDVLARADGARGCELFGDRDQVVIRHGEHEDVGCRGDLDRIEYVDTREQRADAQLGGLGPSTHADKGIAGAAESCGENGADPAGSNHAHGERHA